MSNTQTAAKPKAKPNLTSVTPAGEVAPPPELDTATPIDVSVLPFNQLILPKWGPWMLARMQQHWPYLSGMNYLGALVPHMSSNGSLFIRAKRAVLLAVVTKETLDPRPFVDIVLCFKHRPDEQDEEKDVRLLFRRVEEWAKGMGAQDVRILHPERCDSTFSRLKDNLWADEAKYLRKGLD